MHLAAEHRKNLHVYHKEDSFLPSDLRCGIYLFFLFIGFIAPKILQVRVGLQIVPKTNLQQCNFHYACKCV